MVRNTLSAVAHTMSECLASCAGVGWLKASRNSDSKGRGGPEVGSFCRTTGFSDHLWSPC